MKLLFENWRQYLTENKSTTYYWQPSGLWRGEAIEFKVTHVPEATRRETPVEDVFEEVRKKSFPDRPSRLNCVFLCDNLEGFSGGSYCSDKKEDIYGEPIETYEVELRGNYKILKTNSELFTKARELYEDGVSEETIIDVAESYWDPKGLITVGEILVEPPAAAIIVGKYENETTI